VKLPYTARTVTLAVCAAIGLAAQVDRTRFGVNQTFRLYYTNGSFGLRAQGVSELQEGHSKYYPLPQSSFDDYARLRPAAFRTNPFKRAGYDRQEWIGPHEFDESRLWFGKQFYDAEGMRGVGAFGYFDAETREYRLWSPPEVADYEVRSMLVEPDRIWLGLDSFGEDISTSPGGLVSWDRETHVARRYELEFVVTEISRRGESLYLGTPGGYAILNGETVQRFRLRKDKNGLTRNVPVDRFPPGPSHY